MPVHLIILSDARVDRERLGINIALHEDLIEVVATCSGVEEAVTAISRYSPAVVVVDMSMANALGEVRRIRKEAPNTILLALGRAPESEVEIVVAAEAGIAGYLSPDATVDELIDAVTHAGRGTMQRTPPVAWTPAGVTALTARELEVMELLESGLSNKQIARRLSIRLATVKNHVHSILTKLNVKRRGEIVCVAAPNLLGMDFDRP